MSEPDVAYNCVAWALEDTEHVIWPFDLGGYYWPQDVEKSDAVEAFVELFQQAGYEEVASPNLDLDPGITKIAIFAHEGRVTHVARQIQENGWWTSKLADKWDIEHLRPVNLESQVYGRVVRILYRGESA